MNTQKGFASILLILLGVVVVGGGVYLYTQSGLESVVGPESIVDTVPVLEDEVEIKAENKGIIITSIKANDLVKLPITIEGYLTGTNWSANEGEIGVVEVFDANGKSVSNKEIIKTTTDWMKFPTYFQAMVGDRQMMSNLETNTGTVRITSNGVKDNEVSKSISIPVRFK